MSSKECQNLSGVGIAFLRPPTVLGKVRQVFKDTTEFQKVPIFKNGQRLKSVALKPVNRGGRDIT